MAFGIKINGAFLDLKVGSTISFKKNTELWVSGDPEFAEGSYSFPVDVPLTDHNNYHLRFPGRIDSYTPMHVGEATLYAGEGTSIGLPLFTGDLYVKKGGPKFCSIFMVVNGLGSKKEIAFKDVDMGTGNLGSFPTLKALMDDTTIYPLNHDFVFFPVHNHSMRMTFDAAVMEQFAGNIFGADHQNLHRSGSFMLGTPGLEQAGNILVTPFLRLKVVLVKAAEILGYTLIDDWLIDEELELICIYNNYSINDIDNYYQNEWLYSKLLPGDMKIVDFFKKLCKWSFVGLFIDQTMKTIRLLPYKNILAQKPRHNWTYAAQDDYETEQDNNVPNYIGYAHDSSDQYFANNFVTEAGLLAGSITVTDYWHATGNPNTHSLSDGYYDVKRDGSIVKYDTTLNWLTDRWKKYAHGFKQINTQGRGASFLSEVIPLFMHSGNSSAGAYVYGWSVPRADIPMDMKLRIDHEVREMTGSLTNIRLCIYRGMRTQETTTTNLYPYANTTAYDPTNEAETFDYSLHYDGDRGIYARFGKEWVHFMRYKKIVHRKLKLTIADILNHKEYDIIRIDNMNYFLKSMTVTFTANGMEMADCELVTIPAIGMV